MADYKFIEEYADFDTDNELNQLLDVAKNIRSVDFNYKPESGENPNEDHIGVIAQDLLKVRGLDSAVKEENGVLKVDANKVALAALALVAALARQTLGDKTDAESID